METISVSQLRRQAEADGSLDVFERPTPDSVRAQRWRAGIHPPIMQDVDSGRICWGFGVLDIAQQDRETVQVDRRELSGDQQIAVALLCENRPGRYSWAERDALVSVARRWAVSLSTDLENLIDPNQPVETAVERYRRLPAYLKALLQAERIDLKTAERSGVLTAEVVDLLIQRLGTATYTQTRQAFSWLSEAFVRDSVAPEDQVAVFKKVVETADVLTSIRSNRYPTLRRIETAVQQFQARHFRGTGIQLVPPSSFEGSSFEVRCRFSSPKELMRQADRLSAAAEKSDELFHLLF